jgi:S1-C subfamily serine protease
VHLRSLLSIAAALSFSLITLAGCATAGSRQVQIQPVPPDYGPVCANSQTDPLGAYECGRRLDSYVKRNIAATVKLWPILYDQNGGVSGAMGTGVVVSSDGHVLTAYHVVKDADYVMATVRRANMGFGVQIMPLKTIPMVVVQTDPVHDLALLRPKHPERFDHYLTPEPAWTPRAGELLWHFGQATIGLRGTVKVPSTTVLGFEGLVGIEVKSQEGDSGGPVVALDGKLVGIVIANNEQKGLLYFMPVERAMQLLKKQDDIERVEAQMKEDRDRINR